MDLPARFNGAFAKYQRAQLHLAALNETLNNYYDSKPWYPEKEDDIPDGMVRVRLLRSPPIEISLILGDAIHNMRSALDYATCSLVELGRDDVDLSKTQFPFGEPKRQLTSKEKHAAHLGNIAPHALRAIEEARAYGGKALELLRLLSNQDKHRLLLSTVARQYPMRVHIDIEANTADFVPDESAIEVWFTPLIDGIIVPMPSVFNLRLGIEVEGQEAPFVIHAVDQVNKATGMALRLMAAAIDHVS